MLFTNYVWLCYLLDLRYVMNRSLVLFPHFKRIILLNPSRSMIVQNVKSICISPRNTFEIENFTRINQFPSVSIVIQHLILEKQIRTSPEIINRFSTWQNEFCNLFLFSTYNL